MRRIIACVILGVLAAGCAQKESAKRVEFAIVVHGGAGTILKENMTPDQEKAYRDALDEAMEVGYAVLEAGGSALDAVEATVRIFEDSPLFNAGKGAVFTAAATNEMDASIMDGATFEAGAVASVTTIKNPIVAARAVMEHTPHVMLAGRGAELFAAEQGLTIVDPHYFYTQRRWDSLLKARAKAGGVKEESGEESRPESEGDSGKKGKENEQQRSANAVPTDDKFGTVAAIALDANGNLAAATSTGGLTNKMYGRVGDSPIIGAGTYANNATCAVSGTGKGEYFMRLLIAYDVSARMEYAGLSLQEAAHGVIDDLTAMFGEGTGGIIALDKDGNVAMPFNTPGMYRGFHKSTGEKYIEIYGGKDAAPLKEF